MTSSWDTENFPESELLIFLLMPKKPSLSEGSIPHEPAMALFRLLRSRHMQNVFGRRRFSGLIFDSPDCIQIHGQEIFSVTPGCSDGDRPKIITIMWSIWHSREDPIRLTACA